MTFLNLPVIFFVIFFVMSKNLSVKNYQENKKDYKKSSWMILKSI